MRASHPKESPSATAAEGDHFLCGGRCSGRLVLLDSNSLAGYSKRTR
jgi:hypothetical protein